MNLINLIPNLYWSVVKIGEATKTVCRVMRNIEIKIQSRTVTYPETTSKADLNNCLGDYAKKELNNQHISLTLLVGGDQIENSSYSREL